MTCPHCKKDVADPWDTCQADVTTDQTMMAAWPMFEPLFWVVFDCCHCGRKFNDTGRPAASATPDPVNRVN